MSNRSRVRVYTIAAHAPNRAQLVGVNLEVVDDPVVDVNADHLADHQVPASGQFAELRSQDTTGTPC